MVLLNFLVSYWIVLGFYSISMGYAEFYWLLPAFTGFYCVLLHFTAFYWICTGLYLVLQGVDCIFLFFYWLIRGFYSISLDFNEFYWVLLEFYPILPS